MDKLLKEVKFLKDLNVDVLKMQKRLDKISKSLYEKSEQKLKEVETFEKIKTQGALGD